MPKAKAARPSAQANKSLSPEESVAALVILIQSIPSQDAVDGGKEGGRPGKRAKVAAGGRDPICIARERIRFSGWKSADTDSATITRQNAGRLVSISTKGVGVRSQDLQVTLSPRGKNSASFSVSKVFKQNALSPGQVSAVAVAHAQGFDHGDDGCLWALLGISLEQDGASVQLELCVDVYWNSSMTIWGKGQSPSQQTIRESHLKTWYPDIAPRFFGTPDTAATPQDFYESAFVPDKEEFADALSLQVPMLEATLYPFQRRAVQWLLRREGVQWCPSSETNLGRVAPFELPDQELPVSFKQVRDVNGEAFYMSPGLGVAVKDISLLRSLRDLRGGIIAEEMGLGKTLEVIALMLLHRRPEGPIMVRDPWLGRELLTTPATLIVTPSTLLDQWLSELSRHAPAAKVLYYPGLRKAAKSKHDVQMSAEYLSQHDVVVTTYEVLRAEIWIATDQPARSMRNERQYERPVSPLVQLSWWRVCIDEAQMVENWTSAAAKLARIVPRINAWAITGTPVKDDVQKDLRGLFNFLRYEPYASDSRIWSLFATKYKDSFREVIESISMRHTKSLVRSEITIPPQRRYVITMPFTAVEEQHYQSLFQELVGSCGFDVYGNPTHDDWDPEDPAVQSAMRTALDRLRQTALHPEVGGRNRRALGQKAAPMRTVTEVLDAMLEQSDGARRTEERNLLALRITKGQILAGLDKVNEARAVWEDTKDRSTAVVTECRQQLAQEIEDARKKSKERSQISPDDGEEDQQEGMNFRVGEARRRLRHALEIQHRAIFFCANAYFSIKTAPHSEEFRRLEEMEAGHYNMAKAIRKEILQESYGKAKALMGKLVAAAKKQAFAVIPESQAANQKGIESRNIAAALEEICAALDEQANQLDEWREHVIQLLVKPLVDEEEDVTGEEYEQSTREQDEIMVFVQVLRAAVADRLATITGQKNFLVDHETKVALRLARNNDGPFPAKLVELFRLRDEIKPPFAEADPLSSLKGVISELRGLSVRLRHDAASGSARAANELTIVASLLKHTQSQQAEQSKAATAMEQETELFTDTLNSRLDFYRQLQAVSDMVGEYEGEIDDDTLEQATRSEQVLQTKLATAESKHRYLVHLKDAESGSEDQRMCVICQSTFTIGVLTVCGHQFCKECITLWFRAHHNCPVCKRHLNQSNLHDITFKPQELKVHTESSNEHPNQLQTSPSKKISTIYSEFNPEKLAEIKNIDLQGPNFTTKVDTLVRHLLWLRESDPGAKSIVFSQYQGFLHILAEAFRRYRIGHASFDMTGAGVTQFKEDPGTEVFLLHARAHASGLNLVNASHVFLCEPLLNTALELQAIARVDRIGQQQETTVWLYIVDGTVEESIYHLSVQRRMEHMGRSILKGKSKESTPELLDANLDAANAMEMQQAQLSRLMGKDGISGEVVDKKDLWTCLFGHVRASREGDEERLLSNPVTRGFLAAEAAEGRRAQQGS
ncbi:putative ATP-dependent helicase IRC20 [Podospora aff. communis PSN243]|uniref:ATP-dependent helicase IRC20 n=1 Tax=Podospora aff. communis PSN243 TaxID=3040156 RepID=A0AAV9GZR5_9PEZI|nr:putative ATP-dependent helicase IRC20 [Podospora aff. communis PSN243]